MSLASIATNPNVILLIGAGVIALLFVVVFVLVFRIEFRLKNLFRGKTAAPLEKLLGDLQKEVARLEASEQSGAEHRDDIERRLGQCIRGVGIVRFNPFQGTSGSNQSYAAAFLNESGDGVVFSSLYSRERVSVFAKPLKSCQSEFELSGEEQKAIARAKDSIAA